MTDMKRVLFVGSFTPPADRRIGGQHFACRPLIESDLKHDSDFLLVDSSLHAVAPGVLAPLGRADEAGQPALDDAITTFGSLLTTP
ncbi:hypothetical protein AB3662_38515 [Sorangium cellulosum]|uniref:hypothetical protein n=1 Tax=Sorangium cellulosum TaxID=56 RepID=UPI003D9A3116